MYIHLSSILSQYAHRCVCVIADLAAMLTCSRLCRGTLLLLLAAVLFCCHALASNAEDVALNPDTSTLYGRLYVPYDYLQHPDSHSVLHRMQYATVILTNGKHSIRVPAMRDGSFTVYNLSHETYSLQGDYGDFIFPTVRVTVQGKDRNGVRTTVVRAVSTDHPEETLQGSGIDESDPVIIPAHGLHDYYVPRETFSPMSIFKNPMVLMMVFSAVMMVMMKFVPEEDRKEAERMNKEFGKKIMKRAADANEKVKIM